MLQGIQLKSNSFGLNRVYSYVDQNPINYIDPFGLVKIGNCDFNVFTGKTVCTKTVGNDKNSCDFSSNGDVSCQGKRGPLQCTASYDADSGDTDFDFEPVTPEPYDFIKAQYEALKVGAEVIGDAIEAGAENFMNNRNRKID